MPRPQNLKAREDIIGSAHKLFHAHGYKGVSMDAVAAKAGLKKANLFHYYPSKDALSLAVLARVVRSYQKQISAQFSKDTDPIKTIQNMFSTAIAGMEADNCGKGCLVGNLAQEMSGENERMRKEISVLFSFWTDQIAGFLQRHKISGYFRKEMDTRQSAQALVALLQGAILVSKANKQTDTLKRADSMAAIYLQSLRA